MTASKRVGIGACVNRYLFFVLYTDDGVFVVVGVLWSLGTMHLFGYSITLLNALIPPLIVVIGIPNCIYFLNKFHSTYRDLETKGGEDVKSRALIEMISRMGIVTLFCNIAAAIGFTLGSLYRGLPVGILGLVVGFMIPVWWWRGSNGTANPHGRSRRRSRSPHRKA